MEITRKLLWTVAVVVLVVVLILSVGNAIRLNAMNERMGNVEEDFGAQGQTMAEIWQSVDKLKETMRIFEDRGDVLLIVGTGHEVIVHTIDGRILKCYLPDRGVPKKKKEKK